MDAICRHLEQFAGRDSLRGMVDALAPQGRKLYHLGMNSVSRASLAQANERTTAVLFERVFAALLSRCRDFAPRARKKFRFKESGKAYLLDATLIELPLSLFSWAKYRTGKGAVKLHIGLSTDGYLPEFVDMTAGRVHEIKGTLQNAPMLPQ